MFSIKQSIKAGWEKFKTNVEVPVLATLFILILGSFGGGGREHFAIFLLTLVVMVISIIVKIGYAKIFLRINDGEKPKFVEIFKEYKLFWKYFGASVLYILMVAVGLILFIIPGIFVAIRFAFSPLIVVDTKIGPIKALKESYAITKGNFWKLLGFWVIMAIFNLIGLIVFGIGLLITMPITTFSAVYVYRELSRERASLITASPQTA
jgi:uncharacterized membrane protein